MPDVRPAHAGGSRRPGRPGRPRRPGAAPPTPFSRLAVTHVVSVASEALVTIALAGTLFFSVSPDAARPRVALFLLLTMTPFAVVAPVLGPLMDRARSGRRFFVVFTCVGRALLAWLMAAHRGNLLLFPEAFGVLVLAKGYSVAKSSMVPAVVDDARGETLVEANSRLALIAVIGSAAGGLVAAGVLNLLGSQWVLRLAAVLYSIAAVTALRLPRGVPRQPGQSEIARAELRRSSVLLSATAMAVLRAGVGFLTFFLAFALKRAGEPAWFYGAVIAGGAVGGFVGAVLAPPLRRKVREEIMLAGAMVLPAVLALFAARDPGRLLAIATSLSLGVGAAAGKLAFDSLVQRDAPDVDRSRAFARFETRFQLSWVVGGLLPVAAPLPERWGYLVLALTLGFFGLSYIGAIRRLGRDHAPPGGVLGGLAGTAQRGIRSGVIRRVRGVSGGPAGTTGPVASDRPAEPPAPAERAGGESRGGSPDDPDDAADEGGEAGPGRRFRARRRLRRLEGRDDDGDD